MTEVAFSYLFNTVVRPRMPSAAVRRAYGSIVAPRGRREMIEAAAQVFFHKFPNGVLESELSEFLHIYACAAARRNDIAHGVIASTGGPNWYLEANMYSNKRTVSRDTPYAYTSAQIIKITRHFSELSFSVNAFRDTLKEHFDSSNPKARERY